MDAVTCSSGAISETKMVVSIRLAFVENDGNAGRANLGWFMADDFSSLICDCRTTQRDTRGCLFGRPRISSFLFCFFLRTFFLTHTTRYGSFDWWRADADPDRFARPCFPLAALALAQGQQINSYAVTGAIFRDILTEERLVDCYCILSASIGYNSLIFNQQVYISGTLCWDKKNFQFRM